MGLDRLIAKSLGLNSVVESTAFPRTSRRLIP
ncbi:MAG: hypothetical protein LBU20_00950 [Candidatus Nomurabacteria bacterium]|nr:hypothetical protein [Candidatus Nomurabacteria bacterium]